MNFNILSYFHIYFQSSTSMVRVDMSYTLSKCCICNGTFISKSFFQIIFCLVSTHVLNFDIIVISLGLHNSWIHQLRCPFNLCLSMWREVSSNSISWKCFHLSHHHGSYSIGPWFGICDLSYHSSNFLCCHVFIREIK